MEKIDENDNKIESKTETNMDSNNKEESQCDKDQNEDINSTLKQMGDLLYNNKNLKRGEQAKDKYKFWDTQPVPSFKDEVNTTTIGPIDESEDLELIRKIPLNLPKNYSWHDINIKDKKELKMLYEFLRDNYVEDDDHMFRFDYSTDFLYWHLSAPGFLKQYHLSVFKTGDDGVKHMIGFISAIPVHIYIDGKKRSKVEINFLCVNSAYRSHRLAPVLIKEITRRVNCNNTWQAVYTAGSLLPKPIAITNYYHRNLNLQKLLDVKFTYLNPKLNLARAKGIYKLAKETSITRIRAMEKKDVEGVYEILDNYLSKFKIRPYYSKEEVEHWFVPRKSIVYSYVIENDEGKITDFISFYLLPSSILQHIQHKTLYACYSFMNVPGQYSMKELMRNALILAKQLNFDVYNALNVMDNEPVFDDLLFGKGDGSLKYYFYNYLCPEVQPNELAIVLM